MRARWIVRAMLRVSATACSSRCRSASKRSAASHARRAPRGAGSAGRSRAPGARRPRRCRCRRRARACARSSVDVGSGRRQRPRPSRTAARRCGRRCASIWWAALRSRSGGHTSRFTSRPTAMPMPVSSSRDSEHARVVARAGGQHDERGRRRGRGLGAQPAHRAGDQADQDREPERQRVEAEAGCPSANATSTPSTVAPTCWTPRRSVR